MESVGVATEAAAGSVAANFLGHFNELKDPRMAGKDRYPLGEVLLLAVASTVSDGDGFVRHYGADAHRYYCARATGTIAMTS